MGIQRISLEDNITDEVNPVIELNVSPNSVEQEFESCLNLSSTETEKSEQFISRYISGFPWPG